MKYSKKIALFTVLLSALFFFKESELKAEIGICVYSMCVEMQAAECVSKPTAGDCGIEDVSIRLYDYNEYD